jgi:hypothetical protein
VAGKGDVERRRLVATAGVLSATAFAATVAIGATFGLFEVARPESPVGQLDSRRTVTEVRLEPASPPATPVPDTPVPRADD